mgnify:CR=1 FL=1
MRFQIKVALLLIIAPWLAINGTSLASDWKYVGVAGLSTGEYKVYVDLKKLEKHDAVVIMHELHDFRFEQFAPQGGYKSLTQKWEYECKDSLIRALDKTLYRDRMGKGPVISQLKAKDVDWLEVIPGEAIEAKWRVACALAKG